MIYRYRLATRADASPIFDVLEEVAPEIPVRLDTPEQKELLFERVQTTCASREVWIALDRYKQIVGFLMSEPDKKERSFRDNQALELSYGGVKKSHRGNDIFPDLVAKMKAKGVPLTATVLKKNESDMVNRLLELDFSKVDSRYDRDFLRWQP
jgi:hypothetical protein